MNTTTVGNNRFVRRVALVFLGALALFVFIVMPAFAAPVSTTPSSTPSTSVVESPSAPETITIPNSTPPTTEVPSTVPATSVPVTTSPVVHTTTPKPPTSTSTSDTPTCAPSDHVCNPPDTDSLPVPSCHWAHPEKHSGVPCYWPGHKPPLAHTGVSALQLGLFGGALMLAGVLLSLLAGRRKGVHS